jgi:hypothetical protein
MYRAALLLLLASCGLPGATADYPPAATAPIQAMVDHTLLLEDPGCTGVRIGGGIVVTAKHCTKDKAVGDHYGKFVVEYMNPDHDFSLLSGDDAVPPVFLTDAALGEQTYVVGYPVQAVDGEQQLTITDGVFTGATAEDLQRITAECFYGNSGGGAWNVMGDLTGIVVEFAAGDGDMPIPGYCYMVPIKYVRAVVI